MAEFRMDRLDIMVGIKLSNTVLRSQRVLKCGVMTYPALQNNETWFNIRIAHACCYELLSISFHFSALLQEPRKY
jgi:hypothetical protein